jgi:hypothetical protein
MLRAGFYDHHVPMLGATGTATSAGVAKVGYGPVPEGYCWYIERYSVHCPTGAAVAAVFVAQGATGTAAVDSGYRADYTTAGADAVGDSFNAIYVPAGYHFIVQWTAATSGDVCTASIQYAVHQLDPHIMTSREDVRQIQASHEHATAPVNDSAVAGRRAV